MAECHLNVDGKPWCEHAQPAAIHRTAAFKGVALCCSYTTLADARDALVYLRAFYPTAQILCGPCPAYTRREERRPR